MIGHRCDVEGQVERAAAEGWDYEGDMGTEGEVIDLLYVLARLTKPEVAVETGTYSGKGTVAIASALVRNGKGHLWTVENQTDYEYPPLERTTFVTADSTDWNPPDNIDFAFVDCGPPEVRIEALQRLMPHLRNKATVLVHDTWFYEDEFKEGLAAVMGRKPDIDLKALNGVIGWLP